MSLVEVAVAIIVIALAMGPIINLLSASNKVSNASVFEVMASHHASELGEQLQRLKPWILRDLRIQTGKRIDQLLQEPAFLGALSPAGNTTGEAYLVPLVPSNPIVDVAFFLSPLDPGFEYRTLVAQLLDANDPRLEIFKATTGNYYDVSIGLGWKLNPTHPNVHGATFSLILREDL
jgi:hypothetical protein